MSTPEQLYSRFKPSIEAIANALFEASKRRLLEKGRCLPHAAVQDPLHRVSLLGAAPELFSGHNTATQVMLFLHSALRAQVRIHGVSALGIAETVTITPEGQPTTAAIKVLFEHQCGLAVAMYLPFKKRLLSGYSFGEVMTFRARGEINPWPARSVIRAGDAANMPRHAALLNG